jgi:alpha-tubulin suppressor-like RCC1 family protein
MNDIVRGWTRVEFRDSTCDGNVNVEIEKAISGPASSHSVCIARGGKRVFAFGKNDRGQLGVGDAFERKGRSLLSMNQKEREKKEKKTLSS